ncbi:hypothetical protein [Vagococcus silagei]|uniref:Uncharacterized protein n=1 Tax=Vagococcus silagei TaxID=2508885 RepID=A0A4S3B2L4_9ENTE|nr:hypothetical protein [Vagococcus silagei]THB60638.1 hypothetical protein ESZ54_09225 [Vagococcus silagei]
MTVDGKFYGQAYGSALRSTVSDKPKLIGTESGRAVVSVNPGAVFHAETRGSNVTFGTIYSYLLDIWVNNPAEFDVLYHGRLGSSRRGNVFHSWSYNDISLTMENMPLYLWKQPVVGTPDVSTHFADASIFKSRRMISQPWMVQNKKLILTTIIELIS